MAVPLSNTPVYPFTVDPQLVSYAGKRASGFGSLAQQIGRGAAGGVVGGAVGAVVLSQALPQTFVQNLLTVSGTYGLTVDASGIGVYQNGVQIFDLAWSKFDKWAVDKNILMIQSVAGHSIVVPRAALPEGVVSMIIEICEATMKKSQQVTIARGPFGSWSNIGTGEKIVRGFVFGIGAIVLVFALLIFASLALFA